MKEKDSLVLAGVLQLDRCLEDCPVNVMLKRTLLITDNTKHVQIFRASRQPHPLFFAKWQNWQSNDDTFFSFFFLCPNPINNIPSGQGAPPQPPIPSPPFYKATKLTVKRWYCCCCFFSAPVPSISHLTLLLPWCHLKTTNKCVKFVIFKLFLFRISMHR